MQNIVFDGTCIFNKNEIMELETISIQQLPGRTPREIKMKANNKMEYNNL